MSRYLSIFRPVASSHEEGMSKISDNPERLRLYRLIPTIHVSQTAFKPNGPAVICKNDSFLTAATGLVFLPVINLDQKRWYHISIWYVFPLQTWSLSLYRDVTASCHSPLHSTTLGLCIIQTVGVRTLNPLFSLLVDIVGKQHGNHTACLHSPTITIQLEVNDHQTSLCLCLYSSQTPSRNPDTNQAQHQHYLLETWCCPDCRVHSKKTTGIGKCSIPLTPDNECQRAWPEEQEYNPIERPSFSLTIICEQLLPRNYAGAVLYTSRYPRSTHKLRTTHCLNTKLDSSLTFSLLGPEQNSRHQLTQKYLAAFTATLPPPHIIQIPSHYHYHSTLHSKHQILDPRSQTPKHPSNTH